MSASKLTLALANPCKVCAALDTLPEADALWLDQRLIDPEWGPSRIANFLARHWRPITRKSVSRHLNGECYLGLDYMALRAAA